jgi:hypothetical protein
MIGILRHRQAAATCAAGLVLAVGLSSCGSFDSKASGENLIRDYVKKRGQNRVTLKSVKCPSGVKQHVGSSYACQVVLHLTATNTDSTGTITVHIASGNKVLIEGRQDVRVQ